ncbi:MULTISPECIES: hypothetical protein [Bacillus cereus group]|uniref:Uncharacterized protein n=1 Tax=Bacillus cereus TaxID=1396 RepID=A0A9W7QGQ6_BACCE|nr:hypothetical protein [Bacillus cereus]KAB2397741.1 hypothetical protein F8172_09825 [Bacillus cereus]KAB2405909.1 hypothetical protein F8170_14265 [Bacillus cereus]KAB2432010.1 hypothetical protein F8168_01650 [Bacillus cereus]
MAYLISKKSSGKRYFYIAQYTGKQPYSSTKYKNIYPIGNQKIALERLTLWILDNSFIPNELIEIGTSLDDIKNWKERVEKFNTQELVTKNHNNYPILI